MAAHYTGLGPMERYEYREAVEAFREVRKRAPGWIPGSINLAIALLNDSGVKAEEAKKAGVEPPPENFDESLDLLAGVLERDPANAHAHFCRGIILQQQGNLAEAHSHFKRVTEIDPDGRGRVVLDGPDRSASPTTRRRTDRRRSKEKSQRRDRSVHQGARAQPVPDARRSMGYAMASRFVKSEQERNAWFDRFRRINPDQDGSVAAPGRATRSTKSMGTWAGMETL